MEEDMELYTDSFGEWLVKHGMSAVYHVCSDGTVIAASLDINKLKAGIEGLLMYVGD